MSTMEAPDSTKPGTHQNGLNDLKYAELCDENKLKLAALKKLQNKFKKKRSGNKILKSYRMLISFLIALGVAVAYLQRNSLNSAIVCMIAEQKDQQNSSLSITNETICNQSAKVGYFEWDEEMKGSILGSVYIGYAIMQLPSGYVTSKYGGYKPFLVCNIFSSVLTVFLPLAAAVNGWVFFILRMAIGAFQAGVWPSVFSLAAEWFPSNERGRHFGLANAGCTLGTVLAILSGGLFCKINPFTVFYKRGWAMLFYLLGSLGMMWMCSWLMYASKSPRSSSRLSEKEMSYIEKEIFSLHENRNHEIPWVDIMKCKIVWVLLITQVFFDYGLFAQWILIPSYMKAVLLFEYNQMGIYSALPHLSCWFGCILNGTISDYITAGGHMTTSTSRKLFHFIGSFGTGICLLCVSFLSTSSRYLAVAFFCLGGFFSSCTMAGGYFVCIADISGPFSSIVFGIGNTLASIAGFVAPVSAASILKRRQYDLRTNWNYVFTMFAVALMFSGIMFAVFSSSEPQMWSKNEIKKPKKTAEESEIFINESG